jgi:glycosyltransferase involved in cell wall biosynthesis
MAGLPKISIVVPSYNIRRYIGETLDSILLQKYPNLELIIQDGGSTDGTVEIIKKYAQKHSYINWESEKDKGQTDAINKGLKKATGNILSFINADDVYLPGALNAIGVYFKKHPETLWLAGKGINIDKNGKEIFEPFNQYKNWLLAKNDYRLLLIVNYLMQQSVFFSRKAYLKSGLFIGRGRWVMEYDTWLKLANIKMPNVINRTLSSFRLSGENVSLTDYKNILRADEKIVQKYTRNHFILILHYLHNIARVVIALTTNEQNI